MSLRKSRARRRRKSKRNPVTRKRHNTTRGLRAIESLETRAMLTATPTGAELDLGNLADREYVSLQSADVGVSATGDAVVAFEGTVGTGRQGATNQDANVARISSQVEQEIYVQRFDNDGVATGDLVVVNSVTNGIQGESNVAVADDGSFLVVWSGRGNGDRTGIFGQRFSAAGDQLGEQFRINSEQRGTQSQPTVAITGDGRAVVAWHGPGVDDASGIWMQRISADGELVGGETLVNTTTDGEQTNPSAGIDDAGNFVIAWSSRGQDGDAWGIFAQRFDADGNTLGDEFQANTTTVGSQHHASVAVSSAGQFAIAWASLGQDGDSWGVFGQRFDENGDAIGGEFGINDDTAGHQRDVDIAIADAGEIFVAWNDGQQDGSGWEVAGRAYDRDGQESGEIVSANNAEATDDSRESGHQQRPAVAVSASGRGLITFDDSSAGFQSQVGAQQFDVAVGPVENVAPEIEQVDDQTIGAGETLEIVLTATDANFQDELTFTIADNSSDGATIVQGDTDGTATFQFTPTEAQRLSRQTFRIIVEDQDGLSAVTQFNVDVTNASPVIDLNGGGAGIDSVVDFLMTDTRINLITDDLDISDPDQDEISGATIQLRNPLNVATENLFIDNSVAPNITAVYDNGRKLWTLSGTDTIENYSALLRTLEYENTEAVPAPDSRFVDIVLNDGATDNTALSEEAQITIDIEGDNVGPQLAAIADVTVLAGSPLIIPLNGIDPDGDALSFTATSADTSVLNVDVPVGNRSLRFSVDGFGDMVFELFENLAPRATNRIIELAEQDFHENIIFHRIIDGFVIQGGDPTGTGTGGSTLGDFDDQFHVDLQHNRTGLLSQAKSTDDTNDSQFFITEGPQRTLDFNHTIFGILTEGESVREAISNVPTALGDRPLDPPTITDVEVFADTANGTLMLSAPEGMIGNTTVTVTVNDGNGGTSQQTFNVEVVPDTVNGQPFLDDILDQQGVAVGEEVTVQLTAQDVEGDSFVFLDQQAIDDINAALIPSDQLFIPVRQAGPVDYSVDPNTGLLTFSSSSPGEFEVTVAVASSLDSLNSRSPLDYQVVSFTVI